MAFREGVNGLNAACNGFVQSIDSGSTNSTGQFLFYTGTQPATPATTATGTFLASAALNNPSFSSASSGIASLITSPAVTATVTTSGTPGWFRCVDRNNNPIFDGDVTETGDGGEITFDNITWVESGIATIASYALTFSM